MKINLEFRSPDHVRFENNKHVSGPHNGARRLVKIEPNKDGFSYLVSIYNIDGEHPLWQNNLQMAHKQMKIIEENPAKIVLRGFGNDQFGESFANYGITLNYENNEVENCILHMYDRNVDIKYLSQHEFDKKLDYTINTNQNQNNGLVKENKVNGEVIQYTYLNGVKHGEWKLFFQNGKLKEVGNYSNDNTQGLWKAYYDDGILRAEGQYDNNNQIGLWKFYDEMGNLRAQGNYINNQQTGKWTYYDDIGNVEETENF